MSAEKSSRLSLHWSIATRRRRFRRKLRRLVKLASSPMSPFSTAAYVRTAALLTAFLAHVALYPIEMAFFASGPSWFAPLNHATSLMFLLDFVLAFNTSFQDKRGVLVTSRQEIVRNYVCGWCVPDLLGAVPMFLLVDINDKPREPRGHVVWSHVLLDGVVSTQRLLHVVRVLRLLWMLRVSRSGKSIWAWLIYSRYSHLLRIFWVVLLIVLIAHYIACCWKLLEDDGAAGDTQSPIEQYAGNFYDALQLLQGQGLATSSTTQSVFASFAVLLGSVVLAIVFGNVAMLVSNFNASATTYQRKMESVFAVMSKLQLPALLRERIHQYYEHLWREYESLDGELVKFSKGLAHNLSLEVVLFKYMDLVLNVPFWRNCTPDFQKQIVLSLHVRVYLPDDFILRRGEVGDEFYMINRGSCELSIGTDSFEHATPPLPPRSGNDTKAGSSNAVGYARSAYYSHREPPGGGDDETDTRSRSKADRRSEATAKTRLLVRGQAFGEIALLMNYQRTADVRAVTYVEMCVLSRAAFQQILTRNPGDRKTVLSTILTTCMENNETRGVYCPLKQVVTTVLKESDPVGGEITARYAAAAIAAVVNPDGDAGKVTFGMGKNVKKELCRLKQHGQHPREPVETGVPGLRESSSGSRESPTLPSGAHVDSTEPLNARIQRIESAQRQTLQSLQEIRSLVVDIRRTAVETTKPCDLVDANPAPPSTPIRPPTAAPTSVLVESASTNDADAAESPTKDPSRDLLRYAHRRESFVRNRSLTAPVLEKLTQTTTPELQQTGKLTSGAHEANEAIKDAPSTNAIDDRVRLGRLAARRRSTTLQDLTVAQKRQVVAPPPAARRAPLRGPFKLRGTKQISSSQAKRNSSSGLKARQLLQRMGSIVSFHTTSVGPQQSPTCYADQLFNARENLPGTASAASE